MERFDCVQPLSHTHNMDKLQQWNISAVWTLALDWLY